MGGTSPGEARPWGTPPMLLEHLPVDLMAVEANNAIWPTATPGTTPGGHPRP